MNCLSVATAITVFLFLTASEAYPNTIQAGFDIFRTTGAGKDFALEPIPGMFFDPGSSDFSGLMVFQGDPLTSFMGFQLPLPSLASPENQVDTIIRRLSDATLSGIGSQANIEVQMVDLGLKSVRPIEILNSSNQIELWDVSVRATNNPMGPMTIRQEFSDGGTYDAVVPVEGVFTFVRESDGAVRILDAHAFGLPPLRFELVNVPWMESMVAPPPTENFLVTGIPGLTTNFVPGYSPSLGRVSICGEDLTFGDGVVPLAPHVRGPGTGWHGHVTSSPTSTNFFPTDVCAVPAPSTFISLAIGLLILSLYSWRRPRQSFRD